MGDWTASLLHASPVKEIEIPIELLNVTLTMSGSL
jgi:hypothetical protein